jgi:hypothetical protein
VDGGNRTISLLLSHYPPEESNNEDTLGNVKYAYSRDYHFVIRTSSELLR